jgi:hypothetical protein
MDYHGPLPSGVRPALALQRIQQAEQLGLDQHGAPLAIVAAADGQVQIEARLQEGNGSQSFLRVFSLDHPDGERRALEISEAGELKAFLPSGAVILTAEDLEATEKSTLDAVFAATVRPGDGVSVSLPSSGSSVCATYSLSTICRSMLGSNSDFLAHRSGADGSAHRIVVIGSKPGGAGEGISPNARIDPLFGSDGEIFLNFD